MLIRFTVKRKDNGQAVPGARIEIEKAETVGFTDSQGKAEIVTYWSGNWIYSVTAPGYEVVRGTLNNRDIPVLDFSVSVLYNAISRPPPTPRNETDLGRIGTTCNFYGQGTNGNFYYQVRHDDGRAITSWNKDMREIQGKGERDPRCHEIPKPPPKNIDEIGAEVTTLQKLLNGTVGKIENLGQGLADLDAALTKQGQDLTAGLNGIWDKLEAWLIERIVGIFLKGLDREVEEMRKNGRT